MRLLPRTPHAPVLPGVHGTARVDRRAAVLLPRLQRGDIAVLDQHDLDRATAEALVAAGVVAVVDAGPLLSGRYPAQGPQVLADAGIALVDRVGPDGLAAVRDGARVRVHEGAVWVADQQLASGRAVDADLVRRETDEARAGLVHQLDAFTANSAEFVRREQDLLLHGTGLPRLRTRLEGRTVVVVAPGRDHTAELAGLRPFLREQDPVLVGVDTGADAIVAAGMEPDVVVVGPGEEDLPSAAALRAARDLVVRAEPGAGTSGAERLERLRARPQRVVTAATSEDVALLLADRNEATLVVGVGMHDRLDDFLDRQRAGIAGTFLTRLVVGHRLVDAAAVPHLYSGRVRPRHLLLVLVAGLVALAAAVATTPVGQEWVEALGGLLAGLDGASADAAGSAVDTVTDLLSDTYDSARGLLP